MGRTRIEKADKAVAKAAAPARNTRTIKLLGWLSEIADQPQLMTLCAGLFSAGLMRGDAKLARSGGRMLASVVLATQLKSLVKHRVDRTRPHVIANGGTYEMRRGTRHASEFNSFPSGHTAGAVAVARALSREYPEHRASAYGAAGAVAAVQIPRCQHYVSDLAVGALIGAAAELIVDRVLLAAPRALWSRPPDRPAKG